MKKFLLFMPLAAVLLYFALPKKIVHEADYRLNMNTAFLKRDQLRTAADFSFWQQKLQTDTGSFIFKLELAFQYLQKFKVQGTAEDLQKADSLFLSSAAKLNNKNPEIYYSLSQNAITQHRFRAAYAYTQMAKENKGSAFTTSLLNFDAGMELGMYKEAHQVLQQIRDKESLDYLIRQAKYEDHQGRLDNAIVLMEKALDEVKDLNKRAPYIWVMSNLADMYGHAGRIEESYRGYLNVLAKDSGNLHCLKGIAWIAYSKDKNTVEAKRIVHYLNAQTKMPDGYLTLAEISRFEGNKEESKRYLDSFLNTVNQPVYGAMYNKYLITIYADMPDMLNKAIALSKAEVDSRPTPETFGWLAWTEYKSGHLKYATQLVHQRVINRTFEPAGMLHAGIILAAAGEKAKAKKLLQECLKSSFELGPVKTKEVQDLLDVL
jgi:tetratricopeptide (TPR) repeat protein